MPRTRRVSKPYSLKSPIDRISSRYVIDPETGCWNWVKKRGARFAPTLYPKFYANGQPVIATRYMLELVGRPAPTPDAHCCHHCDNRNCVNPEHLYWGDPVQNAKDRVERGRQRGGKYRGLSEEQVLEAKAVYEANPTVLTKRELAARYGVTPEAIQYWIKRGFRLRDRGIFRDMRYDKN